MSVELLSIVVSTATLLVAVAAGFGWMINRMDARFDAMNERFVDVERDIAGVRRELSAEIAGVRNELTEVKIAVARIEGPRPRFVTSR